MKPTTVFSDGLYLKAEDKQKILADFTKFVDSGFNPLKFTQRLYEHLRLNFGFIAHFDRAGFVSARFGTPEYRVSTLQQIIGASKWSFVDENCSGNADLNAAIKGACLNRIDKVKAQARVDEIAELERCRDQIDAKLLALRGGGT